MNNEKQLRIAKNALEDICAKSHGESYWIASTAMEKMLHVSMEAARLRYQYEPAPPPPKPIRDFDPITGDREPRAAYTLEVVLLFLAAIVSIIAFSKGCGS